MSSFTKNCVPKGPPPPMLPVQQSTSRAPCSCPGFGEDLSLVIAQTTSLKHSGSKTTFHNSIPIDELSLESSKYEVSGQILSLLPFRDFTNHIYWAWNGSYAAFATLKAKNPELKSAEKLTNLRIQSIPGRLVVPARQRAKESSIDYVTAFIESDKLDSSLTSTTWTFSNKSMLELWNESFQRLHRTPISGKRDVLTVGKVLSSTIGFPYSTNLALIEHLQDHIGGHIIRTLRGVEKQEFSVKVAISESPCGFCAGPTSKGKCQLSKNLTTAESTCPLAHKFNIKMIQNRSKPSKRARKLWSTNVPLKCPLDPCEDMIWSYNAQEHFNQCHPTAWMIHPFSEEFLRSIRVSKEEQQGLRIPSDNILIWPPLEFQQKVPITPKKSKKRTTPPTPQGTPSRMMQPTQRMRTNEAKKTFDMLPTDGLL
ncbi:hypothetical protein K435DRAFT_863252 [Dendrothele bispora CBS 962.96]|uniref:Uncharacterized protein n=1 Tax=Dendrothele bispora (strain CBS 962.96) TaxID=1314807 RepID=A0A4S8LQA7_DENBC|nr:hypothetical protein K435DRAFT_863252 [Dendrothele bispora CBS 962.96]